MLSKIGLNELADRHYGADFVRKPTHYLAEYERLFGHMRDQPIRLLELGVKNGQSMMMWRDYFSCAVVVGLDRGECPTNFPAETRFHFVRGEQDDPIALDLALLKAGGQFDIIIDDASHFGHITARSFAHMFPKALKPGGIYVIEDICTSFGKNKPEGTPYRAPEIGLPGEPLQFPSHLNGMVGLSKQLFDCAIAIGPLRQKTSFAIERMTTLPNIVILQKSML